MSVTNRLANTAPGEKMYLRLLLEKRDSVGEWQNLHNWEKQRRRWKPQSFIYDPGLFNDRLALASVLLNRVDFGWSRPPNCPIISSTAEKELAHESMRYYNQFRLTFGLSAVYVRDILNYDWEQTPNTEMTVPNNKVPFVKEHGIYPPELDVSQYGDDELTKVHVPRAEKLWGNEWMHKTLPELENYGQMHRVVGFLSVQ